MTIHARQPIADAFSDLGDVARGEAGRQISEAWKSPARNRAADMPIGVKLPAKDYERARDHVRRDLMRADLNPDKKKQRKRNVGGGDA